MRRIGKTVVTSVVVVLACAGVATGSDSTDVHREATQAARLHDQGVVGTGITVAVIDTGVADVPELDGVVVHQQNISAAPDQGDQYGHGTFVAGLVHRTAPGAKIVSVKLSGANGSVDVTQVLAALQWVVAHREQYSIDVVNLSFGNDSKQSANVSPLNFAVQRAWDAGLVVVASAGNVGDEPGTVTKPGDDPLAISVGATNDQATAGIGDDAIPSFVSRGPTQDGLAKPDLLAPGYRIVSVRAPGSTIDVNNPQARVGTSEFRGSGTSFAAPIISGLVAQMLEVDPTLTPDEVKYALLAGARPVEGDPAAAGAGTARVARSLQQLKTGRANTDVQRSTGLGSLDAARGSARVKVATDGLISGVLSTVLNISGNLTAQLETFDSTEYTASQWGASQWGASQWGASQWGASQWGGSQWGASQWGASQWWASQWG